METFRKTLKITALSLGFAALTAFGANAQNYNNGNNDDGRYSNNGNYNDQNNDDGDDYDASYQNFYDDLAPYGEWINDPDYGYVWVPDVNRDFRPYYTNGYWAQTEYGNTWVSNYDWGWATFHYGRWTYDNSYGWVWIPGSEWAPAWVNWRSVDDGYYGWAPMGPGYDLDYYYDNSNYYGPSNWWVFAPQQYLYSNNFRNYVRAPRYNNDYLRRSNILRISQRGNGYRYFAGPRRSDVERAIGHTIPTFRITDMKRAGGTRAMGSNGLSMYRPRIGGMRSNNGNRTANTPQTFRPQTFRQGRLNIQEGGARLVPNRNQIGAGDNRPQIDVRRNGNQNAGQREMDRRTIEQPQRNIQAEQSRQNAQQQNDLRQRDQQLRQQNDQQRTQRDQQLRQQNDQRVQNDQRQREQQVRQQQDAQRAQQQNGQRQREQQMRQQQDVQRAQQQNDQRQQQMRQQQDAQRAQQQNEQRQREQQVRQQQDQQRVQESRQVREAPVREQRTERAQPQERPAGEGLRRR